MSIAKAVLANDFRNVARDRTVGALLFVPVIFVVLLRFGLPLLEQYVPPAAEYRTVAVSVFCTIAALFPAFMLSFVMLDEKDQQLFTVYRTLPVSPGRLLSYRIGAVTLLGFIYSLVLIFGTQLLPYSPFILLLRALLCALAAPTAMLAAVAFAHNKIEGLTFFKALFFVDAAAVAGVVIPDQWAYAFGVVPAFWIHAAFAAKSAAAFAASTAIAVAFHAAVFAVVYRRLVR